MTLQRAVQQAARDGATWASPAVLRTRTAATAALGPGRGALAAAQAVAEHRAALLVRLGDTGSLYMQAKHLRDCPDFC